MLACPPHQGETSATVWGLVPDTSTHHLRTSGDAMTGRMQSHPPPRAITKRRMRYSPTEETRSGHSNSHVPIRSEPSRTPHPGSRTLPLGRNETIGDRPNRLPSRNEAVRPRNGAQGRPLRQRPLNMETLNDRPAPLPVPQQTTSHPKQPIENGATMIARPAPKMATPG